MKVVDVFFSKDTSYAHVICVCKYVKTKVIYLRHLLTKQKDAGVKLGHTYLIGKKSLVLFLRYIVDDMNINKLSRLKVVLRFGLHYLSVQMLD